MDFLDGLSNDLFLETETWEDDQLITLIYQIVAFLGFGGSGSALGGGFNSWTAYVSSALTGIEFLLMVFGIWMWWPTYFTGDNDEPDSEDCFRSWRWNEWRFIVSPINAIWAIVAAIVWGIVANASGWYTWSQLGGGVLSLVGTWLLLSVDALWIDFDSDMSWADEEDFDWFGFDE